MGPTHDAPIHARRRARIRHARVRDDVAARPSSRDGAARRSRRPGVQLLGPHVDRRTDPAGAVGPPGRAGGLLERQHLLSGAAHDRVLGAPHARDASGAAVLRRDRQHHPRLQRRVSLDVRARGPRDVPPGPRVDETAAGGIPRRRGLRVRAVPARAASASAGALDPVDAVRAVRSSPLLRHASPARARGRDRGARRAELVLRLLHALLHAIFRGVQACTSWPRDGCCAIDASG